MNRMFKPVKLGLILLALSWVLSNIGTSNLYVWAETFGWSYTPGQHIVPAALAVGLYGFGLLYLKYIIIGVLKIADDAHSGAVYVYSHLLRAKKHIPKSALKIATGAVAISALALCVDGVLTGPVSVSSALETSRDVTGAYVPWVQSVLSSDLTWGIPRITWIGMGILSVLFFLHRFGPSRFNPLFGPLIGLYFLSSFLTGALLCAHTGGFGLLGEALNPLLLPDHLSTLWSHEHRNEILGGLFLFFSGFEAAFTDTGLTGKRSMFWAVNIFFVCVVFQYVGQANMLKYGLLDPEGGTPFAQGLLELPSSLAISHSTLAIAATIMASFSLMVAVQHVFYELADIEWFARLKKKYFGDGEFVSYFINLVQWGVCMIIYGTFQQSEHMLAMYGITICAVLISTGVLMFIYQMTFARGWSKYLSLTLIFVCACIEFVFFEASLHKWDEGGYVSVALMMLLLPVLLSWLYFERYKKQHQYVVAKHSKMSGVIQRELVPLLKMGGINAVYCKKRGNLTSTDFCAMRDLLRDNAVEKLYMFSVKAGKNYEYTVTPICEGVYEIIRTYPYKSPQYNDDVLNRVIGTYEIPRVPENEWGESKWKPFHAYRNLESVNGAQTGLLFGIGKIIYQYLKTKEEKVDFNQPVIPINVPVNTEKHLQAVIHD